MERAYTWCDRKRLEVTAKTLIMGILNVTPDSFSDGGRWNTAEKAQSHTREMTDAGADIIDVGAESTRPGGQPLTAEEEIERMKIFLPVVLGESRVPVSVDTYHWKTADYALHAGAHMMNDIWGLQYDHEEIGKILGLNQKHNIIVIGAGNLGQALANYVKFEKLGFVITALFDVNPALEGVTVRGIKIHMLDELEDYCKDHVVDIAALTMPKEKADAIANRLVNLGIQAIWNFAHVDLDLIDKDVVVENVHLSDSLMQLSYNIVKNKQNK